MLQIETVEPHTFSVLKQLMKIPELQDFSLVGGTALSLLYGFYNKSTNPRFGIFCFIDDVKIDIVRHPHPLIRPQRNIEKMRLFSTEDIIAMKVQAILGRGKKKDFWDIAELLNHFVCLFTIRHILLNQYLQFQVVSQFLNQRFC